MLEVGVVSNTHIVQVIAKLTNKGCILGPIAALAVVFADKGAIFVFIDYGGILKLADRTMKPRWAFTTKLRWIGMAHTIVDAEKLAVCLLLLLTKVVGLILTVLTSICNAVADGSWAITVISALTVSCDRDALSAMETVVWSTFAALHLTLKPEVPISALTVLVVRMCLPEVIHDLALVRRILIDAKPACTPVMALQSTIRDSSRFKLAMRSLMHCSAVAWTTRIVCVVILAPATVHTEDLSSIITGYSFWDLAILSNVRHAMLVNRFGTVTVKLVVAIEILQSQYALPSVVAHVVRIGAVHILNSAQ
jgi:hypothetical protein